MNYIECSNGFVFMNTTKHNTIRTDHNFEHEIFMNNSISRHLHMSLSGNRSKVMTYFSRIFDVMVIFYITTCFDVMTYF